MVPTEDLSSLSQRRGLCALPWPAVRIPRVHPREWRGQGCSTGQGLSFRSGLRCILPESCSGLGSQCVCVAPVLSQRAQTAQAGQRWPGVQDSTLPAPHGHRGPHSQRLPLSVTGAPRGRRESREQVPGVTRDVGDPEQSLSCRGAGGWVLHGGFAWCPGCCPTTTEYRRPRGSCGPRPGLPWWPELECGAGIQGA